MTGNGRTVAYKKGTVIIRMPESNMKVTLHNVLLIPKLTINIFSLQRWYNAGGIISGQKIIVRKRIAAVVDKKFNFHPRNISNTQFPTQGPAKEEEIVAKIDSEDNSSSQNALQQDPPSSHTTGQLTRTMHNRCGHVNDASLAKTIENTRGSLIDKPKFVKPWACETCLKAKAVRFSPRDKRPSVHAIMDCVHIDVADVGWTSSKDCKYFVVLTDEFTRFRVAAPIPKVTKKAGDIIIEKLKTWSNQTGRKPVKLMLDNGTDVNIQKVKSWGAQNGITVVTSPPYVPAQNGVAERSVKEILTKLRIAVTDGVPEDCWDQSLNTIVEKINTVVPQDQETSATRRWDIEIARLAGRQPPPSPSIAHWRTLGSKCYITLPENEVANLHLSKIAPKAVEGILIGHEGTHNYIVYAKDNGKIYRTPHIRIIEKAPYDEPTLVSRPLGTLRPTNDRTLKDIAMKPKSTRPTTTRVPIH
ncbi:Retrovirus-related Pol polyprotein from transposon TNT 1-94, partial [Ceratocystis fimbriata CBS 114723]